MIGDNLLRFNKDQRYLVLDCETCNLNIMDKRNVPWQWAWIDCTLKEVIDKKDFFVRWPEINISREAARMTGFYQRTIDEQGKSPEEVLEELDKVIYDPKYKLVIHNGLRFDVYMHNIHRNLLGKPTDYSYLDRVLDTNALTRSIKLEVKPQENENLLAFQYKFANDRTKGVKSSIQFLTAEFGFSYDTKEAHDARYDVELLYQIWKKLIWQLEL